MFISCVALRALPFFVLYTNCVHSQPKDTTQLVAVLVVGNVEESTKEYIGEMNMVANFFKAHGVRVHKFYDNKAQWKRIAPVARDCNFFIYSGHGADVEKQFLPGMLCIDTMVSSDEIRKTLRFNKNPLIINKHVCYAAGSSESDTTDIGLVEARRRILHYAKPYFEIGASGFFATNYFDHVIVFLNLFFAGESLGNAYNVSFTDVTNVEMQKPHPVFKDKWYSITSTPGKGMCTFYWYGRDRKTIIKKIKIPCFKTYDIAYVGPPNLKLADIK